VVAYVAVTFVAASLPVLIAWATKLVLDGIGAGAPASTLLTLAAVLAATGLATAAVPVVAKYLRAELSREVRVVAKGRLYTSVERFGGLARFEDPVFLDRMRLAQQSAAAPPASSTPRSPWPAPG
jgi:ATP-binding cassette subfamily B protein